MDVSNLFNIKTIRKLVLYVVSLQAFLSRAAYYGMKGRYSKGIMSCNEAIKLQPRSVRAYLYRFVSTSLLC